VYGANESTTTLNVVSLLKPGGMLVLMGVFNNPVYTVGHKVFKCLVMQKQDVHNAIEAASNVFPFM
jgi:hypothetical protein